MLTLNDSSHSLEFKLCSQNLQVSDHRGSPSTIYLTNCKSLCLSHQASSAQINISCSNLIQQRRKRLQESYSTRVNVRSVAPAESKSLSMHTMYGMPSKHPFFSQKKKLRRPHSLFTTTHQVSRNEFWQGPTWLEFGRPVNDFFGPGLSASFRQVQTLSVLVESVRRDSRGRSRVREKLNRKARANSIKPE